MEKTFLIGQILLGLYFAYSGIGHFRSFSGTVGYAKSKNLPFPEVGVAGSAALMLVAGLVILFMDYLPHEYMDYALWSLVVFLVAASLWFHNFWADTDVHQKMSNQINFSKNIGLAGALLMLLGTL